MKWQKPLLFLAGSGVALACVTLFGLVLTTPSWLQEFWQALAALFRHWLGLSLSTSALDGATWLTIGAVVMIDLLCLLWFYRRRRKRSDTAIGSTPLSAHRYLSTVEYEALLRQRHAALLARYQDPGLVQFLLNREAGRTQRLDQWFAVSERWASAKTHATPTPLLVNESEAQRRTEHPALALLTTPIGV